MVSLQKLKNNNILVFLPYYASIMLHAFGQLAYLATSYASNYASIISLGLTRLHIITILSDCFLCSQTLNLGFNYETYFWISESANVLILGDTF